MIAILNKLYTIVIVFLYAIFAENKRIVYLRKNM